MKNFTIRLPDKDRKQVAALAKKSHVSMAVIIRRCVLIGVATLKKNCF
jgi:predicted transcriptional regulator